jgi:hypothetical protein
VAHFALRGRSGHQEKNIFVRSNDPSTPQFQLRLIGDIRRSIEVNPAAVAFGRVGIGMGAERKVTISASSGTVFRVLGVVPDSGSAYEVQVAPVTEGAVYEVTCVLRTNAVPEGGAIFGRIVVNTDHPQYPKIEIPVSGMMERELMVIPSQLMIQRVKKSAAPMTRYLLVRSGNQKPFEILKVNVPLESIKAGIKKLSDVQMRIQIDNLVPSDEVDGKEIEIQVRKWNGKEEVQRVPIRVITSSTAGNEPAEH